MTIDLNRTLHWKTANAADAAMLDDLQGNILKSHGRVHAAHLFLRFDDPSEACAFVRELAGDVKNAGQQLLEAEAFKQTGRSAGGLVVCLLSAAGYAALGIDKARTPPGEAFHASMRHRGAILGDPASSTWDEHFQQTIHAMVLIADDVDIHVSPHLWRVRQLIRKHGGVREIGVEIGRAIRNEHGRAIEHFGYVDGISIPVMLHEDLPESHIEWTPAAPLAQALVRDPGGQSDTSYGSFLVFRKLEQNVRAFKQAERHLGCALGLKDHELAGALVIGRFEDGTPLILSSRAGLSPAEPINDFTYAGDPRGRGCPLHAHIRKVNPRDENERARLPVRRGITYGERDDFADEDLPDKELPVGGVGLLFMAYQRSIEDQFEYIQQRWANDPDYIAPGTGPDPIIGPRTDAAYQWLVHRYVDADPQVAPFAIDDFVTLKGGEYFFAPSISFLKSL